MHPYLWEIPTYSLLASVGLFAMMLHLYFRCDDLSFKEFLVLILFMVVGVGIGSKCLFLLTKIPEIICDFSIRKFCLTVVNGGFVFYGGLFGAVAGACLFAKIFHKNRQSILHMVSPGFAVFHIFGRIGCFFAGCCYGKRADWGIPMAENPEIVRIPIQLIESACIAGILCTVLIVEKSFGTRCYSLRIYMGCYAFSRFFLEFWRGDQIRGIWGMFSTSQWISLLILGGLLIICVNEYSESKKRKDEKK